MLEKEKVELNLIIPAISGLCRARCNFVSNKTFLWGELTPLIFELELPRTLGSILWLFDDGFITR